MIGQKNQVSGSSSEDYIKIAAGIGGINKYQVAAFIQDSIIPCNGENETHTGYLIGFALNTCLEGVLCNIQQSGEITNDDWSLVQGDIYFVAIGGTISNIPNTVGFVQKVGIAKSEHILMIDIGDCVKLV